MRDYSYICYCEDELYHHGILGQRWGIRRYQNKDGSLTPRGKKRAEKLQREYEKITGKKEISNKPRQKSISEMSDEELMNARNRMLVENAYLDTKRTYAETKLKDMNAESAYNSAVAEANKSKGAKFKEGIANAVKKSWTDMLEPALLSAGKDALTKYMTKTLNDTLGNNKIDPNSIEGLKATFDKLDYQVKIKGKLKELKGEEKPKSDLEKLKEEAERTKQEAAISRNKKSMQQDEDYFTDREKKLRQQQEAEKQEKKEAREEKKQKKEDSDDSDKKDHGLDYDAEIKQQQEKLNAFKKDYALVKNQYNSYDQGALDDIAGTYNKGIGALETAQYFSKERSDYNNRSAIKKVTDFVSNPKNDIKENIRNNKTNAEVPARAEAAYREVQKILSDPETSKKIKEVHDRAVVYSDELRKRSLQKIALEAKISRTSIDDPEHRKALEELDVLNEKTKRGL